MTLGSRARDEAERSSWLPAPVGGPVGRALTETCRFARSQTLNLKRLRQPAEQPRGAHYACFRSNTARLRRMGG